MFLLDWPYSKVEAGKDIGDVRKPPWDSYVRSSRNRRCGAPVLSSAHELVVQMRQFGWGGAGRGHHRPDGPTSLSRYGDRQLNRALHTVGLTRPRYDEAAKTYRQRRRAESKTEPTITNVHEGGSLAARAPGVQTLHTTGPVAVGATDSRNERPSRGLKGKVTDGQLRAGFPARSTRRRSRSSAARARTWGSFRGSKASACRLASA